MLIARVIAKLEPGGAQLSALRVTAALRERGVRTRFLAGDTTPEGIALARSHGVEVEGFAPRLTGLQWRPDPEFEAWLAPRLHGADVVHAHMFGAWWAAAQAVPAATPLLASEHNAYTWPAEPHDREAAAALERVDRFFAHGPAARRHVIALGLPPQRVLEGRSPVPIPHAARPQPGLPAGRVVLCARLARDKGPDLLLDALARTTSPPPTFILGDGPLRAVLERRAAQRRLPITFTGWHERPHEVVAGAGCLAVPSREDASSQSALLAMGLRVPVVAFAVEGLPALLGDGRGVLVDPFDVAAFAAALEDVLAGRRRPDLDAAAAHAQRFALDAVADYYLAAYRALASPELAGVS